MHRMSNHNSKRQMNEVIKFRDMKKEIMSHVSFQLSHFISIALPYLKCLLKVYLKLSTSINGCTYIYVNLVITNKQQLFLLGSCCLA